MDQARLQELLSHFREKRVAIIGDYFLDKYLDFDPAIAEISVETDKTANQVVRVRHSPGAAGSVAQSVAALEPREVIPIGFTGDDGEGCDLRKDLSAFGCRLDWLLIAPELLTPTYLKPREIGPTALEAERERYDTKNRSPLPDVVQSRVIGALEAVVSQVDAVIVVDQVEEPDCGVVSTRVRQRVIELAAQLPNVLFWVDSRNRASLFHGAIIKPNQGEAIAAAFPDHTGPPDDETVLRAGRLLTQRTSKPVFVTRSERGILVFDGDQHWSVRGVRVEGPIDPTGAGDTATAAAALALTSGGTCIEAALLGNLAASLAVQRVGATGVARAKELSGRLEIWESQKE